jgi:sulfate adenylyltransferase subunit 2
MGGSTSSSPAHVPVKITVFVARLVRFRTLGCYPLTGAIESTARTVEEIVAEMETTRISERQGRLIDTGEAASMEKKKREGYF